MQHLGSNMPMDTGNASHAIYLDSNNIVTSDPNSASDPNIIGHHQSNREPRKAAPPEPSRYPHLGGVCSSSSTTTVGRPKKTSYQCVTRSQAEWEGVDNML